MDEQALQLPVTLPAGWGARRRWPEDDNVIIVHCPDHGRVTVDLRRRNFELGETAVHKSNKTKYAGNGWQARLFHDAISALRAVWMAKESV